MRPENSHGRAHGLALIVGNALQEVYTSSSFFSPPRKLTWNCNNIKPSRIEMRAYLFHMAEVFDIIYQCLLLSTAYCLNGTACNTRKCGTLLCILIWESKWSSETVKLSFIYRIQRCVYKTSLRTHGRKPKYAPSASLLVVSIFGYRMCVCSGVYGESVAIPSFGLKFILSKITPLSTRNKVSSIHTDTHA